MLLSELAQFAHTAEPWLTLTVNPFVSILNPPLRTWRSLAANPEK